MYVAIGRYASLATCATCGHFGSRRAIAFATVSIAEKMFAILRVQILLDWQVLRVESSESSLEKPIFRGVQSSYLESSTAVLKSRE